MYTAVTSLIAIFLKISITNISLNIAKCTHQYMSFQFQRQILFDYNWYYLNVNIDTFYSLSHFPNITKCTFSNITQCRYKSQILHPDAERFLTMYSLNLKQFISINHYNNILNLCHYYLWLHTTVSIVSTNNIPLFLISLSITSLSNSVIFPITILKPSISIIKIFNHHHVTLSSLSLVSVILSNLVNQNVNIYITIIYISSHHQNSHYVTVHLLF